MCACYIEMMLFSLVHFMYSCRIGNFIQLDVAFCLGQPSFNASRKRQGTSSKHLTKLFPDDNGERACIPGFSRPVRFTVSKPQGSSKQRTKRIRARRGRDDVTVMMGLGV